MNKISQSFSRIPYPLSNDSAGEGASIELANLVCKHVRCISADGASCLTYTGELIDKNDVDREPVPVVIKECYPLYLSGQIERGEDGQLTIESDFQSEFYQRQQNAAQAFHLQKKLYRTLELKELIATPRASRSANGTFYFLSDTDWGETLESYMHNHTPSLPARLEIIASIADGLDRLHNARYLYLDLKPKNILIKKQAQSGKDTQAHYFITLFDFDSVVRKEDVDAANLSVSNSGEWSSYEQRHPELWNLVSERSDVYAIGALLFWAITGEKPSLPSIGHASARNKWELRPANCLSSLLLHMTPKVIEGINNLLSKTLHNDANCRLATCEEVAIRLREIAQDAVKETPVPELVKNYKQNHPNLSKEVIHNLNMYANHWSFAIERNGSPETLRELQDSLHEYIALLDKYSVACALIRANRKKAKDSDGAYAGYKPSKKIIRELELAAASFSDALGQSVPWSEKRYERIWMLCDLVQSYCEQLVRDQTEFDNASMINPAALDKLSLIMTD